MRRFQNYLLLLFVFLVQNTFAQDKILSGIIQDEKGGNLAYVNIGIPGSTTGTVSQENGIYRLVFTKEITLSDSIQFSMIGYQSQLLSLSALLEKKDEGRTIVLKQQNFDLPEIVVQPKYKNRKTIGHSRTNPQRITNFSIKNKANQNLGAEIGKKFKLPEKPTNLEQFSFYVKHNNFDTIRFRVNVYELTKNRPDQSILTENIIIELTNQQTGWIDVDLTPYNVIAQEAVAVSVEWVHYSQKGKYLTLPLTFPKVGSTHYYKYGSQSKWKRFKLMSTAMKLKVAW